MIIIMVGIAKKGIRLVLQERGHSFHEAWPTLVLESGDTYSLTGLGEDVKWWFSASDHPRQQVRTPRQIHGNPQHIILGKQTEILAPSQQGATMTRSAAATGAVPVLGIRILSLAFRIWITKPRPVWEVAP